MCEYKFAYNLRNIFVNKYYRFKSEELSGSRPKIRRDDKSEAYRDDKSEAYRDDKSEAYRDDRACCVPSPRRRD